MGLDGARDELGEVHRGLRDGDLPEGQTREIQKVVDEARQHPRLAIHHGALVHERPRIPVLHQLVRRQDGGERIAQLVAQHRQETVALADAALELQEKIPDLVLPAPGAQRGLDRRHEGDLARGAVEQGDVRMPGQLPDGRRDGLRPARTDREHENRQIGPGELAAEDLGELADRAGSERLLGQQERAGAALDLVAKVRGVRARDGEDPGL